jgi:tRNA threonylcarbamoyladenosine biosynthesis protein TsaB
LKTLAIESSIRSWSVALVDDDALAARPDIDPSAPISKALLPGIRTALADAGWTSSQIELIAVDCGPGSFTGLRVGVTAAKTLAYGLDCPLVPCGALEVLAAMVAESIEWSNGKLIRTCMDAERSEIFSGLFRVVGRWELETVQPVAIEKPDALSQLLDDDPIVSGPALVKWTPPPTIEVAERGIWFPNAVALARFAQRQFARGLSADPFAVEPQYYRPSYADEKLRDK